MEDPSYETLRTENQQLRDRVAELERAFTQLQKTCDELRAQVQAAVAASKRQAAPFSKGPPRPKPRRPGRKAGPEHGAHGHRPPPPPEQIDQILEATLPDQCPGCGGGLNETHVVKQYQTDIPRKPVIRQFNIHCGQCRACGKACQGRHPLQTSTVVGAAGSQIGPEAQAAIVFLNKDSGLSYGKIANIMALLFGIVLTRGACAQIVLRASHRLRPAYKEIKERLRTSERITPDETGWRVGGQPAWLHAWVGDEATCYVVSPNRSADALEEVIGLDWDGTLIHDGYSTYDRFVSARHQQCVAHPLRRAHELEKKQTGAAKPFARQVITLFKGAIQVRDTYLNGECTNAELAAAATQYIDALQELTERHRHNEANETFARHLWIHSEHWFTFLSDPSIPATNYQAEQAIRPAVVNRKVWGGNRTDAGAEAQQVLPSVIQTCKQQLRSAFDYIRDTLCLGFSTIFLSPAPEAR